MVAITLAVGVSEGEGAAGAGVSEAAGAGGEVGATVGALVGALAGGWVGAAAGGEVGAGVEAAHAGKTIASIITRVSTR
jgi:hypothetical protein